MVLLLHPVQARHHQVLDLHPGRRFPVDSAGRVDLVGADEFDCAGEGVEEDVLDEELAGDGDDGDAVVVSVLGL